MSKPYKIGQIEKKTGLSAKIIRRYEKIGVLPKASRSSSGYRTYNEKDLRFFKTIALMKNLNMSEESIESFIRLNLAVGKNENSETADSHSKVVDEINRAEQNLQTVRKLIAETYNIKS